MNTITGLAILLTSLAGIVTSIALLWVKVIRPFMKFCRRLCELVEVMQGLPEWCDSVDTALSELKPNGGGSMKDKLNKIHSMTEAHINDPAAHPTSCKNFVLKSSLDPDNKK